MRLDILVLNNNRVYQGLKYSIYAFLTLNIFIFFSEEWAASAYRFTEGVAFADIIEGFVATIDTTSWVVLLMMFELETYILDDRQLTPQTTRLLRSVRIICYAFVVYSFYGYTIKLIFISSSTLLAGTPELCALANGAWSYAIDLDEYEIVTAANCSILSTATSFIQFPGLSAVVDQAGYTEIMRLAWVDVINSAAWLLVVLILEIDVRLQEKNLFRGFAVSASNFSKYLLYGLLMFAAIYWTVKGDFVDSWDAYLWLVAFVFIELNVFEWRQETEI